MFSNPTPSLDGKKLFVIGQQRRFDLIRLDSKSQQFSIYLPGVSAGEADITRNGEWITYVAHPELTLWRSKAGRKLPHPTHVCADAGAHAALVARWNPDRIHGLASGKTLEDLRDAGSRAARRRK